MFLGCWCFGVCGLIVLVNDCFHSHFQSSLEDDVGSTSNEGANTSDVGRDGDGEVKSRSELFELFVAHPHSLLLSATCSVPCACYSMQCHARKGECYSRQ